MRADYTILAIAAAAFTAPLAGSFIDLPQPENPARIPIVSAAASASPGDDGIDDIPDRETFDAMTLDEKMQVFEDLGIMSKDRLANLQERFAQR